MINIYRKYKGQWVALNNMKDRRVVAHGKSLEKVLEEAHKKGYEAPTLAEIPKKILPLVGAPRISIE